MDEILRIRERIDEIDQKLVLLLKDRFENARLLGRIKRARGIASRDPERERIILRKVQATASRLGLEPGYTLPIFKAIFNFSVQAQQYPTRNRSIGLEGKKILIVGGTGGMGRLLANFASVHGASVKIVGRTVQRTQKTAREMEVEAGSISDARSSDIVVVSVPMESVVETSIEIAQSMRQGALLADLSSVKTGIASRISSKVPADDKVMGYVQGLHHFALLSLGVALRKWDGELKTNSIAGTLDRIEGLMSNWNTVVGIQRLNPSSDLARREFIETCRQLVGMRQSDAVNAERILRANVHKWSRKL